MVTETNVIHINVVFFFEYLFFLSCLVLSLSKSPATRNDFVNDIVDDIVTCGRAFIPSSSWSCAQQARSKQCMIGPAITKLSAGDLGAA